MYIKKIIFSILFLLSSFFVLKNTLYAETFVEGDFVGNEYIGRTKEGRTTVSHIRFIEDEQGRKVYCIEPFVNFEEGSFYTPYDEYSYPYISEEKMRKISLIAYFGYGFPGRDDDFWYAITQFMIWKEVDPEADIFFKDFTTGLRDDNRYSAFIDSIEYAVNDYMLDYPLMDSYPASYGETFTLPINVFEYEIVQSSFDYYLLENLQIKNARETGFIRYKQKDIEDYNNDITYYHSENSQDLLLPGNTQSPVKDVNIIVYKGDITLEIENNKDAYSSESSFEEVCYEIYNESLVYYNKVCTNENLTYNTGDLAFGTYYVKQVSTGEGYELDEFIYSVDVYANYNHPVLSLHNKLIKNAISLTKYYCKEEECHLEEGAQFAIYDKKDQLIGNITTDREGNGSYTVGYGSYKVKQLTGLDGYDQVKDYSVKVVDSTSSLHKNLYDQFILLETPIEPEKQIETPKEEPKKDLPTEEEPKEDLPSEEKPSIQPPQDESPKKDEILEDNPALEPLPKQEETSMESPPHTGIKGSLYSYILSVLMGSIAFFLFKSKKG